MKPGRAAAAVDRPEATAFCAQAHVSRETFDALVIYEHLLLRWQATLNLVGSTTLSGLWTRHFADSAQLAALAPTATRWLDLGSGAGFPGLVTALILKSRPGATATLIDSDQRKCAFLRTVARETGAPATILCARIEAVNGGMGRFDVVSARALANLPAVIALARPALDQGATGLFMTGETGQSAMDIDAGAPTLALTWMPSRTQETSAIACVRRTGP